MNHASTTHYEILVHSCSPNVAFANNWEKVPKDWSLTILNVLVINTCLWSKLRICVVFRHTGWKNYICAVHCQVFHRVCFWRVLRVFRWAVSYSHKVQYEVVKIQVNHFAFLTIMWNGITNFESNSELRLFLCLGIVTSKFLRFIVTLLSRVRQWVKFLAAVLSRKSILPLCIKWCYNFGITQMPNHYDKLP